MMKVAVIGGLSRAGRQWERAGNDLGVELEQHDGRRTGTLAAVVRRADLVIAITLPNCHNAVVTARHVATAHGKTFVLVNRLSPSGLGAVVANALQLPVR